MILITDSRVLEEARNAEGFSEDGEPLPVDKTQQRDRLSQSLKEMDRLTNRVDIEGWNSAHGHALLNLAINCLGELMAEVAYLRERLWKLDPKH